MSNCKSSFSKNAHLAYATLLLKWVSSWILPIYALQLRSHSARKKDHLRLLKFPMLSVCSYAVLSIESKEEQSQAQILSAALEVSFSSLLRPANAISQSSPITFIFWTCRSPKMTPKISTQSTGHLSQSVLLYPSWTFRYCRLHAMHFSFLGSFLF